MDELLVDLARDTLAVRSLGKKRNDRGTRVTTDDGHRNILGVRTGNASKEALGTDDVEGGNTEDVGGVVNTSFLKDGGDNGDGGVDRVGDDEDVSLGGDAGDGSGEVADDGGVGVKEVVTGHLDHGNTRS